MPTAEQCIFPKGADSRIDFGTRNHHFDPITISQEKGPGLLEGDAGLIKKLLSKVGIAFCQAESDIYQIKRFPAYVNPQITRDCLRCQRRIQTSATPRNLGEFTSTS